MAVTGDTQLPSTGTARGRRRDAGRRRPHPSVPKKKKHHEDLYGNGRDTIEPRHFIRTGATLLNLAISGRRLGGWAGGRIVNVVGDKSSGKTLLAIEASANFARQFPKGLIKYREAEAAFDKPYAANLGMPIDRIDFGNPEKPFDTVEEFFAELERFADRCIARRQPGLYILDSLDALSDKAEMERDLDTSSYGTSKPKKMSELFRRLVRKLEAAKITLIVISQVRSKIGVSFGRSTTRSGGRALDFYASQILYLAHIGAIKATRHGITRVIGIRVRAKCDKNKLAAPFRECDFVISFGYGIDDVGASLDWLKSVKSLGLVGIKGKLGLKQFKKELARMDNYDYERQAERINKVVSRRWKEIEKTFAPARKKYG